MALDLLDFMILAHYLVGAHFPTWLWVAASCNTGLLIVFRASLRKLVTRIK